MSDNHWSKYLRKVEKDVNETQVVKETQIVMNASILLYI